MSDIKLYNDINFLQKCCSMLRELYDIYSNGGRLHYTDMFDEHDFATVEECLTGFIEHIAECDALNPDIH